jgi:hypothetical protein
MPQSEAGAETATGVYVRDLLACSSAGWWKILTYFFNGEDYEYTFPLGSPAQTLREAQARAIADGCDALAEEAFLIEVNVHPRVLH